jgi:glycosyltransferase involved in cell wall biosynthesis
MAPVPAAFVAATCISEGLRESFILTRAAGTIKQIATMALPVSGIMPPEIGQETAGGPTRFEELPVTTDTTLSVLVPAHNEQYLVEASLARLFVLGESPLLRRIRVIVVDDCSTDRTPEAIERFQQSLERELPASKLEWIFLRHERNQGKGAAIRTALEHADTELTVIHDADLEYHPRDILPMVALMLEEGADAVFGSRFLAGTYKRVLFYRHALGNGLLTALCNLVSDLNLSDIETCYKMVRTRLLKTIPLESSDFRIEPELAIKLAKRGARIFEVPISYSGRTYQEGKKINWKDGVRALWGIVRFGISDHIYTGDEFGGEILMRMSRAPRFNRWMADVIRPFVGERVLEVGAGIGNLTVNLVPRTAYWATDINPQYLDELRDLTRTRPYLRVQYSDVMRPETFPAGQKFDTVICLNVLEHVPDDVATLHGIWEALEPGGRAVVLVPQGPWLRGSLDDVLGHCRRYTAQQLAQVGTRAGFAMQKLLKFNRAGVPAWWLNGKVLRRTTFSFSQIKALNLLTPLLRLLDPVLPFPALSLIAVFEKSASAHPPAGSPALVASSERT